MAFSSAERKRLLEVTRTSSNQDRAAIQDYILRSGLHRDDFARRIGYRPVTLRFFLEGKYHHVAASDMALRAAAREFIAANPVQAQMDVAGKLYRTENFRIVRKYFYKALDDHRAYHVEGDPGTQKSYIAQHLIAELNRAEIARNGAGRRGFLVDCGGILSPVRLMKRIAEACGSPAVNDPDRIRHNLRFELRGRRAVLVFDEAQNLNIACVDAVRPLFDHPPYFGFLFLGSHAFGEMFIRNAVRLEQWNSRFSTDRMLPGMSEEEGEAAIRGELGAAASKAVIEKLLKGARVPHLRSGGKQTYISARRLFWTLADLKSEEKEEAAS